jgi:hypothetical protein
MENKYTLIVGDFVFDDGNCKINSIQFVMKSETEIEAKEMGDKSLFDFDSYIIIPTFKGEISFGNKDIEECFKEVIK